MLYVPNRKLCVCDTCLTQNSILQAQGFQIALSINLEKLSLTLFPCNIQMTFICRIYSHRHTQIMCCNLEESLHVISNFQLASFNYTHVLYFSNSLAKKGWTWHIMLSIWYFKQCLYLHKYFHMKVFLRPPNIKSKICEIKKIFMKCKQFKLANVAK